MDNLKVSHIDSFEITNFSGYMSSIYGVIKLHRGNVHDYLGMYLDYNKQGTVDISIIK